jgi:hypothetical protein
MTDIGFLGFFYDDSGPLLRGRRNFAKTKASGTFTGLIASRFRSVVGTGFVRFDDNSGR